MFNPTGEKISFRFHSLSICLFHSLCFEPLKKRKKKVVTACLLLWELQVSLPRLLNFKKCQLKVHCLLLIPLKIHGYVALCLAALCASCTSPFITNFLFISTCLTLSFISLKCWNWIYCTEPEAIITHNREVCLSLSFYPSLLMLQ